MVTRVPPPAHPSSPDLDSPEARRGWPERGLRSRFVVCFFAALLLVGLALGRLGEALDLRGAGMVATKAWLLRQPAAQQADILLLGTSHALRDLEPAALDAALAEAGCSGRSLNLGLGAGNQVELSFLLDEVDRRLPPGRIVLTEGSGFLRPWDLLLRAGGDTRSQAVGLAYLPEALAVAAAQGHGPADTLPFIGDALARAFGGHLLYDLLFVRVPDPADPADALLVAQPGYLSYEQEGGPDLRRLRLRFLELQELYRAPDVLAEALAALARRDPALTDLAERLVARIRAAGNRPVLLMLPARSGEAVVAARGFLEREPTLPAIDLALDRGVLPWPNPDLFFDQNHATEAGARLLSREVGRQLCALIRDGL